MKRDMMTIVSRMENKIPDAYGITYGELSDLTKMISEGKSFNALSIAFQYGFALALRMVKNEAKKGKKASAPSAGGEE